MITAETAARRIVAKRFREGFIGADGLLADYCPVGIPNQTFDRQTPSHVAPFTVEQVQQEVGFGLMQWDHLDSFQDDTVSGIDASGALRVRRIATYLARFDFSVPGPHNLDRLESYCDRARSLFLSISVTRTEEPALVLRQPRTNPPQIWGSTLNGGWRMSACDIVFQLQVNETAAGTQEVEI